MKLYKIATVQYVNTSVEECWDFFSSPKNLQTITLDNMNFEIKDFESGNSIKKYTFAKGQKIQIAYNSINPNNSIIEDRFDFSTLIIPIVFYIFLGVFLF